MGGNKAIYGIAARLRKKRSISKLNMLRIMIFLNDHVRRDTGGRARLWIFPAPDWQTIKMVWTTTSRVFDSARRCELHGVEIGIPQGIRTPELLSAIEA
jgi:hypothetical protein